MHSNDPDASRLAGAGEEIDATHIDASATGSSSESDAPSPFAAFLAVSESLHPIEIGSYGPRFF